MDNAFQVQIKQSRKLGNRKISVNFKCYSIVKELYKSFITEILSPRYRNICILYLCICSNNGSRCQDLSLRI